MSQNSTSWRGRRQLGLVNFLTHCLFRSIVVLLCWSGKVKKGNATGNKSKVRVLGKEIHKKHPELVASQKNRDLFLIILINPLASWPVWNNLDRFTLICMYAQSRTTNSKFHMVSCKSHFSPAPTINPTRFRSFKKSVSQQGRPFLPL